MDWRCAELRDEQTLEMLTQRLREETQAARLDGRLRADALVYVAPYKKWHRVFFTPTALDMLPVLTQLAHAPCEAPEDHERALSMVA